jgi:hypothetical protein
MNDEKGEMSDEQRAWNYGKKPIPDFFGNWLTPKNVATVIFEISRSVLLFA